MEKNSAEQRVNVSQVAHLFPLLRARVHVYHTTRVAWESLWVCDWTYVGRSKRLAPADITNSRVAQSCRRLLHHVETKAPRYFRGRKPAGVALRIAVLIEPQITEQQLIEAVRAAAGKGDSVINDGPGDTVQQPLLYLISLGPRKSRTTIPSAGPNGMIECGVPRAPIGRTLLGFLSKCGTVTHPNYVRINGERATLDAVAQIKARYPAVVTLEQVHADLEQRRVTRDEARALLEAIRALERLVLGE